MFNWYTTLFPSCFNSLSNIYTNYHWLRCQWVLNTDKHLYNYLKHVEEVKSNLFSLVDQLTLNFANSFGFNSVILIKYK